MKTPSLKALWELREARLSDGTPGSLFDWWLDVASWLEATLRTATVEEADQLRGMAIRASHRHRVKRADDGQAQTVYTYSLLSRLIHDSVSGRLTTGNAGTPDRRAASIMRHSREMVARMKTSGVKD